MVLEESVEFPKQSIKVHFSCETPSTNCGKSSSREHVATQQCGHFWHCYIWLHNISVGAVRVTVNVIECIKKIRDRNRVTAYIIIPGKDLNPRTHAKRAKRNF